MSSIPHALRSLLPHNKGPDIGIEYDLQNLNESQSQTRMTRRIAEAHRERLHRKPRSPVKNLNVRQMFRAQVKGQTAVFDQKIPSWWASSPSNQRRSSTPGLASFNLDDSMADQIDDLDVSHEWIGWEKRKKKLQKCVNSDAYGTTYPKTSLCRLSHESSSRSCDLVESSFDKCGLLVVKPTAAQYLRFDELIETIEDSVGRVQGVCKILVPQDRLFSFQSPLAVGPNVEVRNAKLEHHSETVQGTAYLVNTREERGYHPASSFPDEIQYKEQLVRQKLKIDIIGYGIVWARPSHREPFDEARLLKSINRNRNYLCVFDEVATPAIRSALGCDDPGLIEYSSSVLIDSSSITDGDTIIREIPKITHPVFHLAGRSGPMFHMQMGGSAGYILNYHHAGGPRHYSVVKPADHERLEKLIYIATNPETPIAPTCSEFASHEKLYFPKETLQRNNIAFTDVTQYAGEMIVIFPYAYYQGFNGGPNITEEILYASERWKTFHRKGLFVPCNKDCKGGRENLNLDFARQPEYGCGESDDEGADVLPSREQESEDENDVRPATKRRKRFHRKNLYVPCNTDCKGGGEDLNLDFARQASEFDYGESDDEEADVLPSTEHELEDKDEDEDDIRPAAKWRKLIH